MRTRVAITSDPTSPLARVADTCIVNATPKRYLQPDDLSAKHAQLLVLDLIYLLVAQQDYAATASPADGVTTGRHHAPSAGRAGRAHEEGVMHERREPLPRPGRSPTRAPRRRGRRRLPSTPACDLVVESLQAGGVLQAFGTGHSEAFAMEIAGRAGGLIPTNRIALRDVVLHGSRDVSVLERRDARA